MMHDSTIRSWLRACALVVVTILMLLCVGTFLHETGHVLAAMTSGIPFSDLEFHFFALGPGVQLPTTTPLTKLPFNYYAGGFFAALVLLVIYGIYLYTYRKELSQPGAWHTSRWWWSYPVLMPLLYNVFNGYFEGAYHLQYVSGELPSAGYYVVIFLAPVVIQWAIVSLYHRIHGIPSH